MGKGAQTKAEILAHAVEETAKLGLQGISIGGLAKALDMSKSGLFAHFSSKEALDVAIIEAASEEFTQLVVLPALKAPRGEARLRALVEAWYNYATKSKALTGCLFVALAAELDDQPGAARERLAASQRDWLEVVATVASTGVKTGEFKANLDCQQFAWELHGQLLVFHQTSRLLDDGSATKRFKRAIEAMIVSARK